jgi:hypothetical protein
VWAGWVSLGWALRAATPTPIQLYIYYYLV